MMLALAIFIIHPLVSSKNLLSNAMISGVPLDPKFAKGGC